MNFVTFIQLQKQYDAMTPEHHEAMKTKLLNIAKAGGRKPRQGTLENLCLATYTLQSECEDILRTSQKRGRY